MRILKRIPQIIFSIYGFTMFIIILLLVFPFVVLFSFFGKFRGGNLIYNVCTLWADLAMLSWGMYHRNIYDSPYDPSKQVVFVFNHISYIDIPILLKAFRRQHIRVLGKAQLASVPLFGYIYKRSAIMVDRSSPEARAKSVAQLKNALTHGVSVVIAPEGTFNMTHNPLKEFYDGAFRIAIETNTPVRPVVFLDAHDRLNYKSIFSLSPGKSRAVFLQEISVSGLSITDVPALKQRTYELMEAALIKYNASWIHERKH